jgi:hypothetical protein
MSRAAVRQHVLDERGAHPLVAALNQHALLLRQHGQPAGRAAEDDADVIFNAVPLQPGISKRLQRCGEPELNITVHPPKFFRFDPPRRVKTLDLARDLVRIFARVEERQLAHARLPFEQGRPHRRNVQSDRRDRPNAGHNDPVQCAS